MPIDSNAKSRNAKHHPSSNFFIDLSEALLRASNPLFLHAILKEDILLCPFVIKYFCSHPNPVMIIMFIAEKYHKYCTIARIVVSDMATTMLLLLQPLNLNYNIVLSLALFCGILRSTFHCSTMLPLSSN